MHYSIIIWRRLWFDPRPYVRLVAILRPSFECSRLLSRIRIIFAQSYLPLRLMYRRGRQLNRKREFKPGLCKRNGARIEPVRFIYTPFFRIYTSRQMSGVAKYGPGSSSSGSLYTTVSIFTSFSRRKPLLFSPFRRFDDLINANVECRSAFTLASRFAPGNGFREKISALIRRIDARCECLSGDVVNW